jgi:hypothetical protein
VPSHEFRKDVVPDTTCEDTQEGTSCWYINKIKEISLGEPFALLPPYPPSDVNTELLFRIMKVSGLTYACAPYSIFAGIPAGNLIPSMPSAVGSPTNATTGYGEPAVYVNNASVSLGQPGVGDFDETVLSRRVGTNLNDFITSLAFGQIGTYFDFRYFSSAASPSTYITWFTDFPGCDMRGDPNFNDPEYGGVTVDLSFEVFQATK